jgi:hypothetical protein
MIVARREPAWKEYHTGSPAAGRVAAARTMCSIAKDVGKTLLVALREHCTKKREAERKKSRSLLKLLAEGWVANQTRRK